eukprot:TRINITY_DN66632_c5_g3_i2.p1 TRINITY_DN66632_c5_g3~~TRINITY_DN66632_c5_g3_i2.p1  ORF type:complete len:412 (-),score=64.44 TRINITY_DN66632_c5_g3_i2:2182-3297(-)
MLEDVLGALEGESNSPIDVSPIDLDVDELGDYIGVVSGEFDSDPGPVIKGFAGHETALKAIIATIKEGNFEGAAETDDSMSKFASAEEDDVVALLAKLKSPKTSMLAINQALTLLRSNLWIKPENPASILQQEGLTTLRNIITNNPDDDDLVVKSCQTLEALFDYKGHLKIACAGSKQVIIGKYVIALGKPWDPANFVCGKSGKSITDEFYVINHKPYIPDQLTQDEKKGLQLHKVKWVEPSQNENLGAAIPYINQFVGGSGWEDFISALSKNMKSTKDEYGVSAGAKVIKKMAEVDPEYIQKIINLIQGTDDVGVATLCCCCFMLHAVWTDAALQDHKVALIDCISKQKAKHDDELLNRKAAAVLKRLQA